jgi:hypothetical protein
LGSFVPFEICAADRVLAATASPTFAFFEESFCVNSAETLVAVFVASAAPARDIACSVAAASAVPAAPALR